MRQQAKRYDTTIGVCDHGYYCCPHICTGTIIFTSNNHDTNNQGTARLGDIGVHSCPHCGINQIISCSQTVITNNLGNARILDEVTEFCGSGIIVTGSGNVDSGG